MPRLFVLSGPDVGSAIAFEGTVVLGREKGADLVLHAPSVSRKHARLESRGGRWFVVDLGSSNGTHVGGERVTEAELGDGALFRLGDLELRFRASSEAEARAASPRRAAPSAADVVAAEPAPPSPSPAPLPRAASTASETGEIVLEGDWEDAPAPELPRTAARGASAPSASSAAPRPSVRAAPPSGSEAARLEAARTAAGAGGERATAGGGRILQYHKQERRSGLFTTDFAQQPAWIRWGAIVLLFALAAALAWGAFELTRSMRARGEEGAIEQLSK
jgi:hypothetical protein